MTEDLKAAIEAARKVFPSGWVSSKSAGSALLYIDPRENIGLTYGHIQTLIDHATGVTEVTVDELMSYMDGFNSIDTVEFNKKYPNGVRIIA